MVGWINQERERWLLRLSEIYQEVPRQSNWRQNEGRTFPTWESELLPGPTKLGDGRVVISLVTQVK